MSFIQKNVVNLYIKYELDTWPRDLNTDFTLDNCLFVAEKLRMLIEINMVIVIMILDLIHVHNFQGQTVGGVKILLFLVLI